jgi:histidine triad (HIT) family protein
MLSDKQIKELKEHVLKQIEDNFPADKKDFAKQQILSMTHEEFEDFLVKNNVIQDGAGKQEQKCIFCSIIDNELKSYRIDEIKDAIAVLEINPVSEGHLLIIPKLHDYPISEEIIRFGKKMSERIKKVLSPRKIEIAQSELFGHKILNIIPVYENENINSPRKKISDENLEEIMKKLEEKKEEKKEVKEEKKVLENIKLPKRIP